MYWEPGITILDGRHAVSFNMPIGYYFNRFRNPYTASAGDATFPKYIILGSYGFTFGGRKPSAAPTDAGRSE